MSAAMYGELGIAIGCGVVFLILLALALCRAAAGGDIQILREYECRELKAQRLQRRRSHARETANR
jgi:hypothetical protein